MHPMNSQKRHVFSAIDTGYYAVIKKLDSNQQWAALTSPNQHPCENLYQGTIFYF